MSGTSLLADLNPEQRDAVTFTEGPLLILAGAGSGKTRVLVHRLAYLVREKSVSPEAVLAVTFTNKAAGEMRERVERLLGLDVRSLWVSTFHSTCVRILRREIGYLGRSQDFVIYDEADSTSVIKEVLKRNALDPKLVEPRHLRWRFDQWKNEGLAPREALSGARDLDEERSAKLYASYQELLSEANALDFGDLLLQTVKLFDECEEVLARYQDRFRYVLVDEYQDTNTVQYRLIKKLVAPHGNLCVVGDPDQSIYSWRGANLRNILDFERDYANAKVIKLERNYRSTQPILEGASAVIENNLERKPKRLYTEREGGEPILLYEAQRDRDEAQFVVRTMLGLLREEGRNGDEMAIFYRTNAQSRLFEEELLKYDLPYVIVGGVRFYERAEVKDALAYLRALINPADEVAVRRIINRPARGIGKTTLERGAAIAQAQGVTLLEGLRRLVHAGKSARSVAKLTAFLEMFDVLAREVPGLQPGEALARVLDVSGLLRHLEAEKSPDAQSRIENLRELVSSAEEFFKENRDAFLQETEEVLNPIAFFLDQVALVSDIDQADFAGGRISLMTIHAAKGLEFPFVFLVGMEEGLFPHAASSHEEGSLEEERRLCYVGMTRAMERLTLSCAEQRSRFGRPSQNMPSRFLREIPTRVLELRSARRRVGFRPAGSWGGSRAEDGASPWASRESTRRVSDQGERRIDHSYSQLDAAETSSLVGRRVAHPIFGAGTVLMASEEGENQKFRIRFDRAGIKTILARFANLQFIE